MPAEHDLGHGMRARRVRFDLDGDQGEEEDLPRAHGAVPHGPGDAIGIGEGGRREESRRPGP